MSDLNSWFLDAGEGLLDFGNASTDYPFSVQVAVSDADRETNDSPHPTSDGLIMGRDRLRGLTLQFQFQILSEYPITSKPWMSAMDLYRQFAAKWRANGIRLIPGQYAVCGNTERGVLVFGRPRGIAPKYDMVRKGVMTFQADFETNSPDFYDIVEKQALLTPIPAPAGGIHFPIIFPMSTAATTEAVQPTINDGDLNTWPILEIHGPGRGGTIDFLRPDPGFGDSEFGESDFGIDVPSVEWSMSIPSSLKADEVLTVDTRPWSRSATINGRPANGLISGSQFEKCKIPPGTFSVRYRVSDPTGLSFAVIRWRDAFAAL